MEAPKAGMQGAQLFGQGEQREQGQLLAFGQLLPGLGIASVSYTHLTLPTNREV